VIKPLFVKLHELLYRKFGIAVNQWWRCNDTTGVKITILLSRLANRKSLRGRGGREGALFTCYRLFGFQRLSV